VLIFRRWKISLPLLLLSIGATVFVALTAKPDRIDRQSQRLAA
jgi:uncharacterized protein involved in exopolysaccharide biosynthesis